MESKPTLHVIGTECKPGTEEKFNKWYNEVHIPLALKFKGITRITRYKQVGDNKDYPPYLAIYEFENNEAVDAYLKGSEFAAVRENKESTWKDDVYDMKWNVRYELIKEWKK